jgi:xanthosine phosphorylase
MVREGGGALAVVAGSGMSGVAEAFEAEATVPFEAIEGVGACTVAGHPGEVRWCRTGAAHPAVRLALVLGRRHVYEGEPAAMFRLFEWLRDEGVTDVVVASAAGSLRREVRAGEFVVVWDVLDLQNRAPSSTAPLERRTAVDAALTRALETACLAAGVRTTRGVLACHTGPAYETPAEVTFSQRTGATLVTMSAAPEIAYAGALGMRVAALAAITNAATGIEHAAPEHGEVIEAAGRASADLARLISQLIVSQAIAKE